MTRGGMRRRYTARTRAPPLPRRPRFWPRKPAETGLSGPFFAAEPRVPEMRAGFGNARDAGKIAILKCGRRDRPFFIYCQASYWRAAGCGPLAVRAMLSKTTSKTGIATVIYYFMIGRMKSIMSIGNSTEWAVVGRMRMAAAPRRQIWKPSKASTMADQIYTKCRPRRIPPQGAGQYVNTRPVPAATAAAKPTRKPARITLRSLPGGRRRPGSLAAAPEGDPPRPRLAARTKRLRSEHTPTHPYQKNPFSPCVDNGVTGADRRMALPNSTAAGRCPHRASRLAPPRCKRVLPGPPCPRPNITPGTALAPSCPARRACRAARRGPAC